MKLIDKLPSFYKNYMVEAIQDSYDSELSSLKENIDDTINQMFVNTSTWGLDMWESILCIQNNEDLNYETRRSNIKAKMRSLGTTKLKVIKNICEDYTTTDVEVTVLSNEFIFILEFIVNNCSYNS
ncbi:putative phage tail protein, partial [Clostridioides difficile]|nr:putative phage tail protein [Clostridioides difficile]